MGVLADLDARISDAVHKVISEVVANEPTIDVAVMTTLRDLGAPAAVTDSVQALVKGLVAHFSAEQAAAAANKVPAEVPADGQS
jgi:hypothetical protein